MKQKPSRIKSIVETAIRMLDTRFCVKASYRVVGGEVGVWVGYLNGASHKNVGKPNQLYTPEQLARELELSSRPLQSIVASGLSVRSKYANH